MMEVETNVTETPAEKVASDIDARLEAARLEVKRLEEEKDREANCGFGNGDTVWIEGEFARIDSDGDSVVRTRLVSGGVYFSYAAPANLLPHSALVPRAEVDALQARVRECDTLTTTLTNRIEALEGLLWENRYPVSRHIGDDGKVFYTVDSNTTQTTPPLPDEEFQRELERLISCLDDKAFGRGSAMARGHNDEYHKALDDGEELEMELFRFFRTHCRPALTEQAAANFLADANKDRDTTVTWTHNGKWISVYSPDGSGMSIDARDAAPTQPVAEPGSIKNATLTETIFRVRNAGLGAIADRLEELARTGYGSNMASDALYMVNDLKHTAIAFGAAKKDTLEQCRAAMHEAEDRLEKAIIFGHPTQPVAVAVAGKGVVERLKKLYFDGHDGPGGPFMFNAALSEVRELTPAEAALLERGKEADRG